MRQRDEGAALGDDGQVAQLIDRVAQLARIAHVDREALPALDGLGDVLAADGGGDDALRVADVDAVTRRFETVDFDVDVAPAGKPLGQHRGNAGHVLHRALDVGGDAVDLLQIRTGHLDAERRFDPGGEHVDAVADRRNPDVGEARQFGDLVEFLDQLVHRHAGAPLGLRLELDRGLDHFQRRRIGRGFGAADLAVYRFDFRHGADQAVGLLQQLGRLAGRDAGQGRGHEQQIAFVQRRQEFAADIHRRIQRCGSEQCGGQQRGFRPGQHRAQQGPVDRDKKTVQENVILFRDAAANPVTHQHRHQRHR